MRRRRRSRQAANGPTSAQQASQNKAGLVSIEVYCAFPDTTQKQRKHPPKSAWNSALTMLSVMTLGAKCTLHSKEHIDASRPQRLPTPRTERNSPLLSAVSNLRPSPLAWPLSPPWLRFPLANARSVRIHEDAVTLSLLNVDQRQPEARRSCHLSGTVTPSLSSSDGWRGGCRGP